MTAQRATVRKSGSTDAETPILSQANAVGQGFNVYGALDASSLITPLFNLAGAGYQTFTFLGRDWLIPKLVVGIEDTSTYYYGTTSDTRDLFQNSIAVQTNVDASYGAFSGEFEAAYSSEYEKSSDYTFTYRHLYAQLARLQIAPDTSYLSASFAEQLQNLPLSFTPDELPAFEDFFNSFGVYFTAEVTLGASLGFWVATEKTSELSDSQVSAMFKAQYDGLYTTGSISADVRASQQWKSYAASTQVSVQAVGADPTKGAKVAALDPWTPSSASVAVYSDWIDSVATDAAVVDFRLRGIWELCGPRRKAVQQAWDAYGTTMRPNMVITTSTSLNPPTPAIPPAVSLGRLIQPPNPPTGNAGYQVTVLNGNDITARDAVIFDRYYAMDASTWWESYRSLYQEMAADLNMSDSTLADGNVLVVVGFNVNWNAVPTPDFVSVLRSAGCGDQLSYWLTHNDNGSSLGSPANIIIAGIIGQGIGTAAEYIELEPWEPPTATLLQVLFYRKTDGSGYTIGTGDIS
jgi:hypothetical protein